MTQPLTYDPDVDALAITVGRGGTVCETRELAPGIHADFDANGVLLTLEVLDARERIGQRLFAQLTAPTRKQVVLAEAAERIGVLPDTLRQQLRRGRLSGTKVGRDWFITMSEIARYQKRVARGARPTQAG